MDFRLPFEAATTSAAAAAAALINNNGHNQLHMFPAAAHSAEACPPPTVANKKKRKPSTKVRSQPTSTITSQQLALQIQQHLPSTSMAAAAELLAGPSNAVVAAAASAGMIAPQRPRSKVYQCRHCTSEFAKLKDRNSHLIDAHQYVRRNRRLICNKPSEEAPTSTVTSADLASTSAAHMPSYADYIEDSKQGIVKLELESNEEQSAVMHPMAAGSSAATTKTEFEDNKESLALVPLVTTVPNTDIDTKPNLQALALTTPTTKLATLYRMLVSYNMSTLKQNQNLSDNDEKLIESSIFFCYVCRQNFNSVKLYDAHLTEHAAECFTCGKKFQRWKNFSLHLKRHLGWKEFGCSVCDKKFVVRSALVEHMRMHTGQNPLKCKICGK